MLAFLVGGVAIIFIGLVYAELTAAMPRARGEHVSSPRALGPASHGALPSALAHLHPRWRTPHRAVLLVGGFAVVSPLAGSTILVWLIDAGSFALVVAYALVAASFLVLRRREPELPRPFRAGRSAAVGWLALALSLAIGLVYLPGSPAALKWPWEWGICLAWAAAGLLLHAVARRERRGGVT
jgi:amino acid transporter